MSLDPLIFCPECNRKTDHVHLHNAPHGLSGGHMEGTERYECSECGRAIHVNDPEVKKLKLKFTLDKPIR